MANGNGLFEEMRRMLDTDEVPEDMSRRALWGALAVVYKKLDGFGEDYREFRADSTTDRKKLNTASRILMGVSGFFILIHLPEFAKAADSLWKLMLALL